MEKLFTGSNNAELFVTSRTNINCFSLPYSDAEVFFLIRNKGKRFYDFAKLIVSIIFHQCFYW